MCTSESTIIANNWPRSKNFPLHPVFNISLNNAYCSFTRDVHRCHSYGTLCQPKRIVIIDLGPEAQLFTDTSNFEIDILVPHSGLYVLERSISSYIMRRLSPLSILPPTYIY